MTTKVTVFNHGPKNIRVFVKSLGDFTITKKYNSELVQPGIGQEFYVHSSQDILVREAEIG